MCEVRRPCPESKRIRLDVNCGDWVESCTAVVEQFDGRLEIVEWSIMEGRTEPNEAVGRAMTTGLAAE
jgi:hypothetical protein